MMRPIKPLIFAGLAGALLLVGCAQTRPFEDLWVTPRPYPIGEAAVRPPTARFERQTEPAEPSAVQDPTGTITLHDAVRLALRQNHALAAAGWATTAAQAEADQMGRPRNPSASFAVENFAGPDAGETFQRQTLRISQVIELADKRAKRQTLGEAAQRLRAWDYEQLRLDVASQTARRFLAVVVAQQRLALAEQQLQLAEAGFKITDDRVRQGVAPGLERDQAAVRVTLSRIVLENARQALAADRVDLAAMWAGNDAQFGEAVGELRARVKIPPLDGLKQRARESPAVARWDDEIELRRAALDLERAKTVTDPSVGGGVRYFSDADDFAGVFDVSWPLPVFDDNRSAVLSARLKLAQARSLQEQASTQIIAGLTRAYTRAQAAEFSNNALREEALPSAESAYQAALDSYRAGQSDYMTVLEAERSLLAVRNQQLDVEWDYHRSLIEIENISAHAIQAQPKTVETQ